MTVLEYLFAACVVTLLGLMPGAGEAEEAPPIASAKPPLELASAEGVPSTGDETPRPSPSAAVTDPALLESPAQLDDLGQSDGGYPRAPVLAPPVPRPSRKTHRNVHPRTTGPGLSTSVNITLDGSPAVALPPPSPVVFPAPTRLSAPPPAAGMEPAEPYALTPIPPPRTPLSRPATTTSEPPEAPDPEAARAVREHEPGTEDPAPDTAAATPPAALEPATPPHTLEPATRRPTRRTARSGGHAIPSEPSTPIAAFVPGATTDPAPALQPETAPHAASSDPAAEAVATAPAAPAGTAGYPEATGLAGTAGPTTNPPLGGGSGSGEPDGTAPSGLAASPAPAIDPESGSQAPSAAIARVTLPPATPVALAATPEPPPPPPGAPQTAPPAAFAPVAPPATPVPPPAAVTPETPGPSPFPAAGSASVTGLDPSLVGTWESRFSTDQGAWSWTWTIAADGTYHWSSRGPIPLPDETGKLTAGKGTFRRASAEGRVDEGTYTLAAGALKLKTPVFEQSWTRR